MFSRSNYNYNFDDILLYFVLFCYSYQYGPDTYLMQVKDPDFSARLREYLGVAKTTSAEFQECKVLNHIHT